MRSFLILLLSINIVCFPEAISGGAYLPGDTPTHHAPRKLVEAWLRFHEMDLCQEMDAVFAFNDSGMEVWCLVKDERSYQKLQELLEPLRATCRIELYTTRLPAEKKSDEDRDPPASLWENTELRSYLGDPVARAKIRLGFDTAMPDDVDRSGLWDVTVKERMLLYAEEVLEWNQKMQQYAKDLPELARVALDPAASPELKSKASAACAMHAQNLGKNLARLETSLREAFPRSTKKSERSSSRPAKAANAGKSLEDSAARISSTAQDLARRIYHFIYPEHYTVNLDELRRPGLLEELNALGKVVLDFQKALTRPVQQ